MILTSVARCKKITFKYSEFLILYRSFCKRLLSYILYRQQIIERIDEREVTISASSPESEEDDYHEYLVPRGSTATIACELENSDEIRELTWRRDGVPIYFNDDDSKVEHVINGLKHYLVIHDTQPEDSACYSVCINNIEFKIAHMIVSEHATSIAGKRTKRISSTSLHT